MYAWLKNEHGPKMIVEAVKLLGVKEDESQNSNQVILDWAKEVGLVALYNNDETAWCGLFMAVVAKRAGKEIIKGPLWARNWAKFGAPVSVGMLGDVLVFTRGNGGHVGLYVGEDEKHYHVLGGNQGNEVNVMRILKARCIAIRRPVYSNTPKQVRIIKLAKMGTISNNEQ